MVAKYYPGHCSPSCAAPVVTLKCPTLERYPCGCCGGRHRGQPFPLSPVWASIMIEALLRRALLPHPANLQIQTLPWERYLFSCSKNSLKVFTLKTLSSWSCQPEGDVWSSQAKRSSVFNYLKDCPGGPLSFFVFVSSNLGFPPGFLGKSWLPSRVFSLKFLYPGFAIDSNPSVVCLTRICHHFWFTDCDSFLFLAVMDLYAKLHVYVRYIQ